MHSSLVALKLKLYSWLMVFKFLCTKIGKYYKLPLGMQRPKMNNELSKGRCAICKGRISVMLYGYMHTM